jgi:hypothetical protein
MSTGTLGSGSVTVDEHRDVSDRVEIYRATWTDPTTIWRRCVVWTAECALCGAEDDFPEEHAAVAWGEDHHCAPAFDCVAS